MSITVSVKFRDGIVLGSDSMSQIYMTDSAGNVGVAQTYGNARKLFQVANLPVGVTTYGAGNIGVRSMQGLIEDFSDKFMNGSELEGVNKIELIAEKLLKHIKDVYDTTHAEISKEQKPIIGIFLGGYSEGSAFPEEWEFVIPRAKKGKPVRPIDQFGASWRGVSLPFTRLHMGYDPRIIEILKKQGVKEEVIRKGTEQFRCNVAFDAMPLQDAVNFANYVLTTTVGFSTFDIGPPSCGGSLDIAYITKRGGFKWVTERKVTIPNN